MRIVLLVSLVIVLLGGGALLFGVRQFDAAGPLAVQRDVVVPRGGLSAVAEVLAGNGVIENQLFFRAAALATIAEGPIHAAELSFPAGASVRAVLDVLRSGRPVQHKVTISEGLTAAQIAGVWARADALSGDVEVPAEGRVLPDTYVFERSTPRSTILSRSRAAMTRAMTMAWAG